MTLKLPGGNFLLIAYPYKLLASTYVKKLWSYHSFLYLLLASLYLVTASQIPPGILFSNNNNIFSSVNNSNVYPVILNQIAMINQVFYTENKQGLIYQYLITYL